MGSRQLLCVRYVQRVSDRDGGLRLHYEEFDVAASVTAMIHRVLQRCEAKYFHSTCKVDIVQRIWGA